MADPTRPRTLSDLLILLLNEHEDVQDTSNEAVYDSSSVMDTVGITDSIVNNGNVNPPYRYAPTATIARYGLASYG